MQGTLHSEKSTFSLENYILKRCLDDIRSFLDKRLHITKYDSIKDSSPWWFLFNFTLISMRFPSILGIYDRSATKINVKKGTVWIRFEKGEMGWEGVLNIK